MAKPIVAVVGRPNVGKSTLFNKIAGERVSIVEDTPNVTRDRIYVEAEWLNYKFTLIDTGGLEPESDDAILKQIYAQAEIAMEMADVILFVVDVKTGVTDMDMQVANILRKTKKPLVLAVNKVDDLKNIVWMFMSFILLVLVNLGVFPLVRDLVLVICLMKLLNIFLKIPLMMKMMTLLK